MLKLIHTKALLGLITFSIMNGSYAAISLDFNGLNQHQQVVNATLVLNDSYQLGAPITPGDITSYRLFDINGEMDSSDNWVLTGIDATLDKNGKLTPMTDAPTPDAPERLMTFYDQFGGTPFWLLSDGSWGARGAGPDESGTGGQWSIRQADSQPQNTVTSAHCVQGDRFHKAAAKGDVNFVQACLNAGIAVDTQEGNGWTALHAAARQGQIAVVDTLLRHDADPTIRDKTGRTPLDQASFAKQQKAVEILKEKAPPAPIVGGKNSLPPAAPVAGGESTAAPPRPTPGSVNNVDLTDPNVIKAAEFAATDLARWRPESMTSPYLHSVVKAAKQVVAGTRYQMTIKTNDTNVYTWEVVVFEDLQGGMSLSESRQIE